MWRWSNTVPGCWEVLCSLHLQKQPNWTQLWATWSNWTWFEHMSWFRQSPEVCVNLSHSFILWCFTGEKMNSWKTEIYVCWSSVKSNQIYDENCSKLEKKGRVVKQYNSFCILDVCKMECMHIHIHTHILTHNTQFFTLSIVRLLK